MHTASYNSVSALSFFQCFEIHHSYMTCIRFNAPAPNGSSTDGNAYWLTTWALVRQYK